MKKKMITFLMGLMAIGVVSAQSVIFDPSMHELGVFQGDSAKTIVEIDGMKYLKVELAGWGSSFQVSSTVLNPNFTNYSAVAKYEVVQGDYTIDQINTAVKLVDNTSEDFAEIGVASGPSSEDFSVYEAVPVINDTINTVTNVQIWGQETVNWGALESDFLYLGKIMAYKYEEHVLFDPAGLPDSLPAGMEVVEEDGETLLKIELDGWNTALDLMPFSTEGYSNISYKLKVDVADSGIDPATIQSFVKVSNANGSDISITTTNPAVTELTQIEGTILSDSVATVLQLAAQSTEDWSAVSGVYMYISKVTASGVVAVESITVSGEGDATVIDVDGGTLQMSATVMPENASDASVTWSVDDDAVATIDDSGLLTAVADGSVVVKATANDGSGVEGTVTITVSNQVGINDVAANTVNVYPNPATSRINIAMDNVQSVEIYNMLGAKVIATELNGENAIDINNLENGVYILKATDMNGMSAIARFNKR